MNRIPPSQPGRATICGKCKAPLDTSAATEAGPIHVTDSTFAEQVERSQTPVLLDLWAEPSTPAFPATAMSTLLIARTPINVKATAERISGQSCGLRVSRSATSHRGERITAFR